MPFDNVTITVTWGPAGGTDSELTAARTKALAMLGAEYAKYADITDEAKRTKIDQAYEAGKADIVKAATVDGINEARAKAIRALAAAAADTDNSLYQTISGWGEGSGFNAGRCVGYVDVIMENTTCDGSNLTGENKTAAEYFYNGGKPFVNKTHYPIGENDNMMTVILRVLKENQFTWEGTGSTDIYKITYLASITGSDGAGNSYTLAQFTGGNESGWMGTLNDFFVNRSFSEFTVEDGKLADGDVIRVMYTQRQGHRRSRRFGPLQENGIHPCYGGRRDLRRLRRTGMAQHEQSGDRGPSLHWYMVRAACYQPHRQRFRGEQPDHSPSR